MADSFENEYCKRLWGNLCGPQLFRRNGGIFFTALFEMIHLTKQSVKGEENLFYHFYFKEIT